MKRKQPGRPRGTGHGLTRLLTTMVTPALDKAIRREAKRRNLPVSAVVRDVLVRRYAVGRVTP